MKKKILTYIKIELVPFILQLLVRFIYLSNKKVFFYPKEKLEDSSYLFALWHGELLMQPFNVRRLRPGRKISAMISEHRDGEAISRTNEYLGIDAIRGSSTRGATKVLISAIKMIKNGTSDVVITPDGPKGPRFSVASGVVAIAQKTKSKIVILNCKPSKYWQLSSWDKFIVPKPFGTIEFYASEAFSLDDLELEEAKELIKEKLLINAMK